MNYPQLSIIIPAYNASASISTCVSSILNNDLSAVEIIVVDDGSEDSTSAVMRRVVEASEGRVHYVWQERSGVSAARNRGFSFASASWVMFVDADDEIPQNTLQHLVAEADQVSEVDIVVGDFLIRRGVVEVRVDNINASSNIEISAHIAVLQRQCIDRIGFSGTKNVGLLGAPWAKLYRSSFLRRSFPNGPFAADVSRGEDVLFNVEAFGLAREVLYTRHVCYIYVVSKTSSSRRPSNTFQEGVLILTKHLSDLISRYGWAYLDKSVARMTVTLFDETILRLGERKSHHKVRALATTTPFVEAIRAARLTDFTVPSLAKFLALRCKLYRFYLFLLSIASRRQNR